MNGTEKENSSFILKNRLKKLGKKIFPTAHNFKCTIEEYIPLAVTTKNEPGLFVNHSGLLNHQIIICNTFVFFV